MCNRVVYVIINGELGMSPGKVAAQSVHAAAMLPQIGVFGKDVQRTVLVLEAKDTQQILAFHNYLQKAGIFSNYYIDEGVNEVDVYSVTALAAGPIMSDDLEQRELFKGFDLYPRKRGLFS